MDELRAIGALSRSWSGACHQRRGAGDRAVYRGQPNQTLFRRDHRIRPGADAGGDGRSGLAAPRERGCMPRRLRHEFRRAVGRLRATRRSAARHAEGDSELYPAIMREISYWLLTGPEGGDIMRMTRRIITPSVSSRPSASSRSLCGARRVEELATIAQLSPSAFHRQFKTLTSMTPLQYQKQLRLLEARRLMVSHVANVETAAYQVGSRARLSSAGSIRMFGAAPRQDIASLRRQATGG